MSQDGRDQESSSRTEGRKSMMRRLREAQEQFEELTGLEVEGVSGFESSDDGWVLTFEVVELRRIPDTVSLLATYSVRIDSDGELQGYRRTERYTRGRSDGR
ncbi:gas vesicle protein [Nocardiopsis changdeensis]|uniref:Gas vesicle protein n=1 Tax=Nocardiopsis changdeensis TaxID=2831969 RepID=A0ABX8BQ51_9ACTN|nr:MULTISPECIES: gas vesicle protein [Nocardiopsis]QKW31899.1 gas vesicle protein [Nocardiopsis flavescens]QUX23197.1 gas vesicle protein [Nocardiopsis changdeensis]QYX39140.1 gas vesicle protein [Nocardiopsis sp. MT53]